MEASQILKLQQLATQRGKLERQLQCASPSAKVILRIQLNALDNALTLESRGLRREEWKVV